MISILKLAAIATIITLGILLAHRTAAEAPQGPIIEQKYEGSIFLVPGQYEAPRPIFDAKMAVLEVNTQHYGKEVPIKEYAKSVVVEKWGESEWFAFNRVVEKESQWNHNAVNSASGACGIPQALPCSKLGTKDPQKQIDWMVDYISERYSTPTKALEFHIKNNWY